MTDLVGQTLGSYTITERIGGGGMADVYKAFHSGLSVHRAVKVIRPELSLTEDFRERFQKEARSVAALRHPNIVQMHDFGTHQNTYYMVMEFIEGHDLKRLLRSKGRIRPIQDVVDLIAQVADALAYAHGNGLIHRDIKPENIMITARGQAILTDFGIAKLLTGGTRLTQTGGTLGTPAYMAPEQALGNQEIGPPSDIYALTVVLYELLTGRTPFEADTPVASLLKTISNPLPMPQHLAPDVGDAVQGVIIKGTAKQPGDRFDSMVSLREALLDAARRDLAAQSDRATIVNTPPRTPPETLRPRSRTSIWVVAAGGAAIALAAGAAYWFTGSKPSENASVPTSQTTQPMDVTAPPVENRAATTPMASNDSRPPDPLPTATSEEPAEQRQGGATQATARGEQSILPQRVAAKSVEDSALRTRTVPEAKRSQITESTRPVSTAQPPENVVASVPAASTDALLASTSAQPVQAAVPSSPSSGGLDQVRKGQTTQSDLIRLFGGPNLTTVDEVGRETWIYERTQTQTDVRSSSQAAQVTARLGLFFNSAGAAGSAEKAISQDTVTTTSAIRSVTVIVKFSADRTVYDYTVRETYF